MELSRKTGNVIIMVNSRRKGADGERELRDKLIELGFHECRRGQQFCGANGDADVVGVPGLHIECKRVQALNLPSAMAQSIRDARDSEIPVVMHRKDRDYWKVTMRLEDFAELWKKANGVESNEMS